MKCTVCSTALSPTSQFCRGCGTKLSPLMRQFVTNEARSADLLEQFRSGGIDQSTFQAARSELVFQDPSGVSWFPGDEPGTWLAWDGQAWHPADPHPVLKNAAPAAESGPGKTPISQAAPLELPISPATQMIDEADIPRIASGEAARPAGGTTPPQQPANVSPAARSTQMVDEADLDRLTASAQGSKLSPGTFQPRSRSSLTQPPNVYLLIFAGFLLILLAVLVTSVILRGDDDPAGSGVPYPAATSELTITPTETQPPLTQGTLPAAGDIDAELPLPPLPTVDLPGLPPPPPVSGP